jgi:phenylacetic acid degradation operon negative regulatory protein
VWLSPHPSRAAEARQVIGSLGPGVQATMLHARLDDPGERHRLVARAWDVGRLDARHRGFIRQWAEADPASPEEAFIQRMRLVYQYRLLMLADPRLPSALLPPDWSGEQARLLVLDRHASWEPLATKWWDAREAVTNTAQP